MKTNTPAEAIKIAQEQGWIAVRPGVYLNTQESIIADQESWLIEGDRVFDFTTAPFWLTTDSGTNPLPIYGASDDDLIELLREEQSEDTYTKEISFTFHF